MRIWICTVAHPQTDGEERAVFFAPDREQAERLADLMVRPHGIAIVRGPVTELTAVGLWPSGTIAVLDAPEGKP